MRYWDDSSLERVRSLRSEGQVSMNSRHLASWGKMETWRRGSSADPLLCGTGALVDVERG